MNTPSEKDWRLMALSGRLRAHLYSADKSDSLNFCNLCISLARCIDIAIAHAEVPIFDQEFPGLLKQVCKRRNDCQAQAAIMVLMISVKSACENGWFTNTESEELKTLAYEIGSPFCGPKDTDTVASSLEPTISTIMSRFYPQMKMGQILASLMAKPGYEAYVMTFQIQKNVNYFPEDKICLFVAQIDNTETSACIISPQEVNFLLNGNAVERRTNIFMDNGPQLPTNVTGLIKYGTNLLQAVGRFNGNYIIIVALMSIRTTPVRPSLPDFVQPTVALPNSDSELIEGASRVSLNCPISKKRIKTPVKGHSCNHRQSFDLDDYVDMNSRRPSWRCPHCNQSVCFSDMHIDQNMVKILEEVGENVDSVMISADGSWTTESNDSNEKQLDKTSNCNAEIIIQEDNAEIMDLTEGDDETDTVDVSANTFLANNKDPLSNLSTTITGVVDTNTSSFVHDSFWSGVYLSTLGPETSGTRIDSQITGVSAPAPTSSVLSPLLTDAISPALNHASGLQTSFASRQNVAPVSTQSQQFSNSYMNRVPVSVPANPAQSSTSVSGQSLRNTSLMSPNSLMVNSSGPGFSNVDRQRTDLSSLSGSHMAFSSLQQHNGSWGQQGQLFSPNHPSQPNATLPAPSQNSGGYQVRSVDNTGGQNLHQQQSMGQRMSHTRSQSPSLVRPSAPSPPTQTHQTSVPSVGQQSQQGQLFSPNHPSQPNATLPAPSQNSGGYQVRSVDNTGGQNLHQQQSMGQRMSHTRSQSPSLVRPSAPSPPTQTHQTSVPSIGQQSQQFRTSAQRASHMARMRSQSSVQAQAHRPLLGNTGGTVPSVTMPEGFVDSSTSEKDWRPTGRMRGSLSGPAYSAAYNQVFVQPTQPIQPTRPLANVVPSVHGVTSPLPVPRANSMNSDAIQMNHLSTQPASAAGSGHDQSQVLGNGM